MLSVFSSGKIRDHWRTRTLWLADTADKETFNLACSNSWVEAWGTQYRDAQVPWVCSSMCV